MALGPDGKPRQQAYRVKWQSLQAKLLDLTDPGARGYAVHGLRESQHVGDTAIRVRGEAERRGPSVARGFPTAFAVPDVGKIDPAHSGRLELAKWLTSPHNPLTPRVMVNRIWQHLFGQGLVSTMDNFGTTGDSPSHPELLDYLATQFVEDGWSVKKLVRTLVLSHAYRLGEDAPAAWREIDPENRLLWRHTPRRLDAEEIRDSMLAAAGRLQLEPPAGAAAKELKMIELRDNGPLAGAIREAANRSEARSIYLPLLRGITPDALAAFDPVTQTLVTGQREVTTVPVQALFLLNSAFVRKESLALAERLLAERDVTDVERIRQAHTLVLGRAPAPAEIKRARGFLGHYEERYQPTPRTEPVRQVEAAVDPDPDADDMDRTEYVPGEPCVQADDPRTAAWSGPRSVLEEYGVTVGPDGAFARQCLMARRLSEAGVRFVEVCQSGWDHHTNLHRGLIDRCRNIDQPVSALLTDLGRRGLLEETLVIFGSEFGRLPMAQGPDGRDHNITGYSMFLAGAGVKHGFSYGATDELGVRAVDGRMHTTDLHATLLALLGLNHKELTYRYAGRAFRLTDVGGEVHQQVFS